jgi:hypothetical protein
MSQRTIKSFYTASRVAETRRISSRDHFHQGGNLHAGKGTSLRAKMDFIPTYAGQNNMFSMNRPRTCWSIDFPNTDILDFEIGVHRIFAALTA